MTRILSVKQGLGHGCQPFLGRPLLERPVDVGQAGEQPLDIGIEQRIGQIEGNRKDSRGGVGTDAGKIDQLLVIRRHFSRSGLEKPDGCPLKVAGAAVVSQPLPGLENGLLRSSGH